MEVTLTLSLDTKDERDVLAELDRFLWGMKKKHEVNLTGKTIISTSGVRVETPTKDSFKAAIKEHGLDSHIRPEYWLAYKENTVLTINTDEVKITRK